MATFGAIVARNLEVLGSNPDRSDVLHITVLHTLRPVVYSAV